MAAPLSPAGRSGKSERPIVTSEPSSEEDLLIVEQIDVLSASYTRLEAGTLYKGYVQPITGARLYGEFQLISENPANDKIARRTWMKLPGVVQTSKGYDERGDLETTEVQYVTTDTPPDPDGLLVNSSSVTKDAKARSVRQVKTVASRSTLFDRQLGSAGVIPERFLAGEILLTTDDIVDPATAPDALSYQVLASTVTKLTKTKSRKDTVTCDGVFSILEGAAYDEETGLLLPYSEQIVPAGTDGSPLDGAGNYSEVSPLSPIWSLQTTRRATSITDQEWTTSEDIDLPRVLVSLSYSSYKTLNRSKKTYYVSHIVPTTVFRIYSGTYVVTYRRRWQKDPFNDLAPTILRPGFFSFETPLGGVEVGMCLHPACSLTGGIDADDPSNDPSETWNLSVSATVPDAMPPTVVLVDDQKPYKGGFLRTTKTITTT